MVIDANVYRALGENSIKEFLNNKGINIDMKLSEYSIDSADSRCWIDLLEKLCEHNFIKISEVEEFLSDEFNYGRAKNVYIEFIKCIKDSSLNSIINRIQLLEIKGYKNAKKVTSNYFIEGIREFIQLGEERLIESKIDLKDNKVSVIRLLFGEGISINQSERSNNYYSVEINLEINILSLRMINWAGKVLKTKLPDNRYEEIFSIIKNTFSIESSSLQKENQDIVYKLVDDLTSKVLKDTVDLVDSKIKSEISSKVETWGNTILSNGSTIGNKDKDSITRVILNNYYRIKISSEHKILSPRIMKEKFGVQAYARQVQFFDETSGEGKARSSDTKESVLDTSIFYDIKARLDKEKNIENAIIYWMSCKNHKAFGTVIHLDVQNRFKLIFYPKRIDKEMFDYVLQEIERYSK